MDRRKFLGMLAGASVLPHVALASSNNKDVERKIPKAILVDPYQVNLKDLADINIPELKDCKIVRLRRPAWNKGEPIRIIY